MPPDITIIGGNGITFPNMATWGWEIALYLFIGGLVAGLMVFSGAMRLARLKHFPSALFVADLASLPLLSFGMLFLFLDLSNKINVWRLYTTFQINSPMSWGAWILLVTMVLLGLRFVSRIPVPRPAVFLGLQLFPAPPANEEEAAERPAHKTSPVESFVEWTWKLLDKIARRTDRSDRVLALIGIVLGIGLGFYTGILLSTIPSRPLWNTAILAPLFLVSGLASGGAFLCLFLPGEEHQNLVPYSILFCGVELLLLLAFVIYLNSGNSAAQHAGSLLFNGVFGWSFWGLVVLIGLLVPAVLEQLDLMHRPLPFVPARVPPVLKMIGSLALRFVIVYAGLLSFM
jgi:protein NrfD